MVANVTNDSPSGASRVVVELAARQARVPRLCHCGAAAIPRLVRRPGRHRACCSQHRITYGSIINAPLEAPMLETSLSMADDRFPLQGTRERVRGVVHKEPREVLALVLAWSREEPGRIGEVALIDGAQILGRGGSRPEDTLPRARFQQQRPGTSTLMAPL